MAVVRVVMMSQRPPNDSLLSNFHLWFSQFILYAKEVEIPIAAKKAKELIPYLKIHTQCIHFVC